MKRYLKNTFMLLWYTLFNKEYRLLKKSLLFDPVFYLKKNPDVAASGLEPLLHYVKQGYQDDRSISQYFDQRYYLKQLIIKKLKGVNPMVHYLSCGWSEGFKPNYLFDPFVYINRHSKIDFSSINPLVHYIQQNGDQFLSPYFDPSFYVNTYSDVDNSGLTPFAHFLEIGLEEQRQPSLYFDAKWYLDKTPVLHSTKFVSFKHYVDFGIAEGKSPSPLFDPKYYSQTYNVFDTCDKFAHYIEFGVPANHRPCSWFDPKFYREEYLDRELLSTEPLAHFLEKGLRAGLYPNRDVFTLPKKPLISILVPVYNVSLSYLNNCIRSVLYQSYPHWELCLADDCSTDETVRQILKKWAKRDDRIKLVCLDRNMGIAGATNAAASLAVGDYIGFLDNDDELALDCLFSFVSKINTEQADLYYSDEVLVGDDGHHFSEFRKPDFNENLLLSHNYVTHFVVVEAKLYRKVGGLDSTMNGAQDFDLFLKLSEYAKKIIHIPEILYYWRAHENSTSVNHEDKSYADEAGYLALKAAMKRRKIAAVIEKTEWKFFYRVNRNLFSNPKVSVLIRFRENNRFWNWLSDLAKKTSYKNVEFLILMSKRESKLFADLDPTKYKSILCITAEKALPGMYNAAAKKATGEYLVFLDSRLAVLSKSWIEELLKQAMTSTVGLVTGRVLAGEEGTEISRKPNIKNDSSRYYNQFLQECSRHLNGLECEQNVFALSCDFTMVKRSRFQECNGFDCKSFPSLFADSDLCLRMRATGYENLYIPFVRAEREITHTENEHDLQKEESEKTLFQKRWYKELYSGDPYYNHGVIGNEKEKQSIFLRWYAGENGN